MSIIFLCYRREDAAADAGRICDHLITRFGQDAVFIDVDSIDPGTDFVDSLNERIGSCSVLIALIGPTWLSSSDSHGRRLDQPDDWVRVEIITAHERRIRIIPVLVGGAIMPHGDDLPDSLRFLARLNAIELRHTHFRDDIRHLLETAGKILGAPAGRIRAAPTLRRKRLWQISVGAASVALLGLLAWRWIAPGTHLPPPPAAKQAEIPAGKPKVVVKRGIRAPNLVGLPADKAQEILRQSGLAVGEIRKVQSDSAQPDTVVDQSPPPGAAVEKGAPVAPPAPVRKPISQLR